MNFASRVVLGHGRPQHWQGQTLGLSLSRAAAVRQKEPWPRGTRQDPGIPGSDPGLHLSQKPLPVSPRSSQVPPWESSLGCSLPPCSDTHSTLCFSPSSPWRRALHAPGAGERRGRGRVELAQ